MTEEDISDAQRDDLRPCEERNREEGEEDIDHGQDKDWTQYFQWIHYFGEKFKLVSLLLEFRSY